MPALLLLLFAAGPPAAPDFDRVIAPLLARRCLDCHGGAAPEADLHLGRRKTALAALARAWERVRDGEMPPNKPLPADEREALRRWIAAGAKWGTDPIDPFRFSTDHRAGYDWWSLRPVHRPEVPAAIGEARTPIDRFWLARLRAAKLGPSPEADRRTLLRRVTFDLIGLPPTPQQVDDFLSDRRPDAYERLVDRLLASPQFGERWGRHWLDVVRFGESDGFERDLPRFNAWPYRDWVVRALNADLPYDEFARRQLAGDAAGDLDATGFLVAGPHDIVVPVGEVMRETMRQDELEDIVGTTGQVFLGLTVHCARCHDHKFDAISQKDYYRLASALAGVGHGERVVPETGREAMIARLRQREADAVKALAAIEEPVRRTLLAERLKDRPAPPKALAEWDFTRGPDDERSGLKGTLHGGARRDADGLHLDGKGAYLSTRLRGDLGEKTLEAWVRLANLDQRGGGVMSVQTPDGNVFDAIVFGEQSPRRWLAGSDFFRRTRPFGGDEEAEAGKRVVQFTITYAADGTVAAYRDGRPYGKPYRAALNRFRDAQVVFGLRHAPAGGNRMLAGTITRARLYDRALSAEEVAGRHFVLTADVLPRLSAEDRRRHRELSKDRDDARARLAAEEKRPKRKLYAVNSLGPRVQPLLIRGNAATRGEVMSPEVPSALATTLAPTKLRPDAPDIDRRRELARWISDRRNPLFARVIVNRLWHHHFGTGIVDTPSDFGFNGGRPTHPELLDWLAAELMDSGWSLKHLHRRIVTSAVYLQSSSPRPDALKADADNRLLWRRSPVRLEAETIRDAMLAVAGELSPALGGPSYLDFRTYFFKGTQFYDPLEEVGPTFRRRSIYRMWARGGRSPFLDTFDCPDPSTTTPRRASTTTPLQALSLFNNAMVLSLSDAFAARVKGDARPVDRAFLLAYGRPATDRELKIIMPFVERHGLPALCRVLFNSSEFVQVD